MLSYNHHDLASIEKKKATHGQREINCLYNQSIVYTIEMLQLLEHTVYEVSNISTGSRDTPRLPSQHNTCSFHDQLNLQATRP